jgi:hypothetical protein
LKKPPHLTILKLNDSKTCNLRYCRSDAVGRVEKREATSPQTDQVLGRTTVENISDDCWGQ